MDIALELSQAAYCGKEQYLNHFFSGAASGFLVDSVIFDLGYDTEGFVGYLPSGKAVYVAYRGSATIKNWINNANIGLTRFTPYKIDGF